MRFWNSCLSGACVDIFVDIVKRRGTIRPSIRYFLTIKFDLICDLRGYFYDKA